MMNKATSPIIDYAEAIYPMFVTVLLVIISILPEIDNIKKEASWGVEIVLVVLILKILIGSFIEDDMCEICDMQDIGDMIDE